MPCWNGWGWVRNLRALTLRELGMKVAVAIACALACLATPAQACRVVSPQSLHLAQYETVLLATVLDAREPATSGWITWDMRWKGVKRVAGAAPLETYQSTVTLFSEGCRLQPPPPPAAGETWALYFSRTDDRYTLAVALPVSWAAAADTRVSPNP